MTVRGSVQSGTVGLDDHALTGTNAEVLDSSGRIRALGDLGEIIGHIAADDREAASRFGNVLLGHVDLLTRFPRMGGRIRKRSRVRKLQHSPVLGYYRVREDKRLVEVLHIRHELRKSPNPDG
jgi:plasmid stabilization system protein ParE